MSRESYFEREAFSRSLLDKVRQHPLEAKASIEGKKEESEALIQGDYFDTMMFDAPEVLAERFAIITRENPAWDGRTNMGKLFNLVLEQFEEQRDNDSVEINMEAAYTTSGIKTPKTWQDAASKLREIGAIEYLEELIAAKDKISISMEVNDKFITRKYELLSNEFFGKYFVEKVQPGLNRYQISDSEEVIYQLQVYWNQDGVEMKSMLDIVVVDHVKKTIRGKDLKTSSSKKQQYEGSIHKYGYYLQGGMYYLALLQFKAQNPEFAEYTVEKEFDFLFVEKSGAYAPFSYTMSEADVHGSLNGGTINGEYVPGILDLIKDLSWHIETDVWEYSKKAYENGGGIKSKIFDEIV